MRRVGWEVHSRTEYILGIDHCMLQNVAVWDARNNMDHYLVLVCLCGAAPTAHSKYMRKHTRLPIYPPITPDGLDCLFAELQETIPKLPWRERLRQEWISPGT